MAVVSDLRVEWVKLSEIVRWPRNPKDHDLGLIYQSISRFGFVQPLLMDEGTGRLVAGHGRLDTLIVKMDQGEPAPAGIKVSGDGWLVPVLRGISFTDEHEAEAYLLADNRLTEMGGWVEGELALVLQDHAMDLGGIGFDGDDIDELSKALEVDDDAPDFIPPPEYEITPELFERHDYIVLMFDNELDWQRANDVFGLKSVSATPSGKKSQEMASKQRGLGRVIDGADVLKLLEGVGHDDVG